MAAQHGVDGATRDSRGGLKFNKNTKRGRQEEEEMGIDLDEVMGPKKEPKKRKEQNKKLGEEFKAKVSFFWFQTRLKLTIARWRRHQATRRAGSLQLRAYWTSSEGQGWFRQGQLDEQEEGFKRVGLVRNS